MNGYYIQNSHFDDGPILKGIDCNAKAKKMMKFEFDTNCQFFGHVAFGHQFSKI